MLCGQRGWVLSGGLFGVDVGMVLSNVLYQLCDGYGGGLAQYGQFTHQHFSSVVEFETAPRDQSKWGLCVDFKRQYARNLFESGEMSFFYFRPMRSCAVRCQGRLSN